MKCYRYVLLTSCFLPHESLKEFTKKNGQHLMDKNDVFLFSDSGYIYQIFNAVHRHLSFVMKKL